MRDLGELRVLAAQAGEHPGHEQHHAVAARVDDAVLAQYGEQLGPALHRTLGGGERLLDHLGQHRVLLLGGRVVAEPRLAHVGQLGRHAVRHLAHDRDHRALGRVAHRRIGRVGGPRHRGRDEHRVDQLARPAGKLLGRAAHDLREDHAAVAARAEQRRTCDRLHDLVTSDLVHHLTVQAVELGHHGAQRLHHVVAGVPVGDREHVQVVDLLAARLELGAGRGDHLPEALD